MFEEVFAICGFHGFKGILSVWPLSFEQSYDSMAGQKKNSIMLEIGLPKYVT